MDNRIFDIRGDYSNFSAAIGYLKTVAPGGKAVAYSIVPKKGLVLYWNKDHWTINKSAVLRFSSNDNTDYKEDLNSGIIIPDTYTISVDVKDFDIPWEKFVESWYPSVPLEDFYLDSLEKQREYFDGHCGRGFRMSCESWGHVGGCSYAFAIIKPISAWYGK